MLFGRAGGPTDPLNVATLSAKSVKVRGFIGIRVGGGAQALLLLP
jgi:hypothetical protein